VKQVVEGMEKEKLIGGKAVQLLNAKLEQTLVSVTENDSFKEKINDGTRNFVQILRKRFPEITKREAEIASLLNKGMSSKEISELVVIDIRAIEQHRYRVRKKLGLKTGDDLALALMNLVASP
jgi:DNA-binding CsgD family transcriptional regulator